MFQATRRRLALWYTTVTAVLLLLFASGFYWYVRDTLVERIDDTLNHVVEVVQRSLVIDLSDDTQPQLNLEASFHSNADAVDDDHIDLEWFSPTGEPIWTTLSQPLTLPLHISNGETVRVGADQLLRQVTQRVEVGRQVLGYLRVSHPWFEVTKPTRQLMRDLAVGMALMVGTVATIGWLLSGLAMAPIRDSYQRLKQFTADASHELRNPIAVIQTNVQVALADPNPQLQEQQLRVVERLTRRLGRLVDDLLFLARQDSHSVARRTDALNLEALVQEVVDEQDLIAADQSIQLVFTAQAPAAEEGAYRLQGDRDQLTRLFTNLISNAIQYSHPDSAVVIHLQRVKLHGTLYLHLSIQDKGIGIPEESLPHIFDRFYRVDPARSHSAFPEVRSGKTGSGLGLAIAKVIVESHQGQLLVESQPNQGTTFTVLLPQHRTDSPVVGS